MSGPSASASAAPVLVTGGAGFLGSHVVDRLVRAGRQVVVLDDFSTGSRENLEEARRSGGSLLVEQVDIRTGDLDGLLAGHRPRTVIHLAAQMSVAVSVADPVADAMTNVVGTVRLLEAARRHGVSRVVFASSGGAIYGEVPPAQLPVTEDHDGPGLSPYGAAKRAAEEYLRTFASLYGLAWTVLAPSNVYGPRQNPHAEGGAVARFIRRMQDGQPCLVNGDGRQTRDFVHVQDVAEAFVLAIDAGAGERLNVGTGQGTTILELLEGLAEVTGRRPVLHHGPARPGDVRHSVVSPRRAQARLGWTPRIPLREGLRDTVAWATSRRATAHAGT